MKSEFLLAITQLSAEKRLPKEVVLSAVESALASAYRRDSFSPSQNVEVKISPNTGKVEVWAEKMVVESPTDPRLEISLEDARKIDPEAELDQPVMVEATPANAGRIAAQTAKQVILQRLHEAEHSAIVEEYAGKEGDIVNGIVQRIEMRQALVDLGRAEALLPAAEQMPNERYRIGQRLKVLLLEVMRTNKGPRVIVSRTHPDLVRRLFEMEVPEIYNGIVEIKSIAREAGYRTKVAVAARQEGLDPVGCCVGLRGIRIQNIVNELNGEKIDVVLWNEDVATFIAGALSPAQIVNVDLDREEGVATVVVPDRQLSLAIGKEGQNARLAAKLAGWRVDIKALTAYEQERADEERLRAEQEAAGLILAEEPDKEIATAEEEAAPAGAEAQAAPVEPEETRQETVAVPAEAEAPGEALHEAPAGAEPTPVEMPEVMPEELQPAGLEDEEEEPEGEDLEEEELDEEEFEEEEQEDERLLIDEEGIGKPIPFELTAVPGTSELRFAEDILGPRPEPRSRRRKSKRRGRRPQGVLASRGPKGPKGPKWPKGPKSAKGAKSGKGGKSAPGAKPGGGSGPREKAVRPGEVTGEDGA